MENERNEKMKRFAETAQKVIRKSYARSESNTLSNAVKIGTFEIKTISKERTDRIYNSIDRILNKINNHIKERMENESFLIVDIQNGKKEYPNEHRLMKALIANNVKIGKWIIVMNLENIDELKLDVDELDGVISHELGHIFNPYKSDVSRSMQIMYPERYQEIPKNCEFNADDFSNMTKCKDGLIRSIKKVLDSDLFTNADKELFEERLVKLENNETYRAE